MPLGSTSSAHVSLSVELATFLLFNASSSVRDRLSIRHCRAKSWRSLRESLISCTFARDLNGSRQDNFSFSGALRPLSKLIICAVMLRGRHRGLPVAIDRAVMLPAEFSQASQNRLDDIASNNVRRSSMSMQLDGMNRDADERSQFRKPRVRSPSTILTNGPESPQSPPNPASPQSLTQQQQNDHVETQ